MPSNKNVSTKSPNNKEDKLNILDINKCDINQIVQVNGFILYITFL